MKGDDRNHCQVELIHGLDYSPRRICGLRVACNETKHWVAPLNWTTGDHPAIYHSFDSDTCLTLHGATLQMSNVSNLLEYKWNLIHLNKHYDVSSLSLFSKSNY